MYKQQIAEHLQKLLKKVRKKQLENEMADLRKKFKKLEEPEDIQPYDGPGWQIISPWMIREIGALNNQNAVANTLAWASYSRKAQADWQIKSEQVRRKVQRLALLLNPPGWRKPWTGGVQFWGLSAGPHLIAYFHTMEARDEALRQLGDDIMYLDWYNSPEFRDGGRV